MKAGEKEDDRGRTSIIEKGIITTRNYGKEFLLLYIEMKNLCSLN